MKLAFSLVELSIVLVILGLLTGGILTGQNLIRAAELRAISTELSTYQTSVHTFWDKYFYLPGDMPNATDFWGAAKAGGGCDTSTAGTGTQTCNGNGNGDVNAAGAVSQYGETFTFWQHMANAGLIEGTYSGMTSSGNVGHAIIGENVPRSKFPNAGWSIGYWSGFSGDTANFAHDYSQHLVFGSQATNSNTNGAVLTPEEAWNIDTKVDDGKPGRGRLFAIYWDTCTDATGNTDYDANYLLSDTAQRCAFRFPLGW